MTILDTNTVGGRIRTCRKALNLTLVNLAERIDVSPNYISVIERGVKNPSDRVLHKIADLANVSYWWLKTGEEESPISTRDQNLPNAVPVNIDVPLFLSLVIREIPGMTKEKLAAKLDVSPEDIDKILFEDGHATPSAWTDYFPVLARQMDLSAIRQKIRNLDLFFRHESEEKDRRRPLELVRRYAGLEYSLAPDSMRNNGITIVSSPENPYSEHIVLQKNDSLYNETWHFFFYRDADTIDKSLAESIMSNQLAHCEKTIGDSTLVFDNDDILQLCVEYYERKQGENDACAGTPYDNGERMPPISLLLIDRETWEPKGDIIRLEDD